MKKVLFALLIVFVAATGICSAATLSAGVGNEDNSPKVQSTFFGVSFGERNPWDKMAGLKGGWYLTSSSTDNYCSKSRFDVSFAGFNWTGLMVCTVKERFSDINFGLVTSNKKKAVQRYRSVLEVLSEKYPMEVLPSDESDDDGKQTEQRMVYSDGVNFVVLSLICDVENYTCLLGYYNHKAFEIRMKSDFDEL